MKKVLTFAILIFASVLTFACKDGAKAQPNEPEQKEAKSGEVIVMNKDMFIKDVFDYEKSKEWKYKGDKPAIIDLYADWCGPCRMTAPIMKLAVFEPAGLTEESVKYWMDRFGKECVVVTSGNEWIDFIPFGTNKAKGIREYQKRYHISPEECISFGDEYNDIEMLKAVKYGFAMEHSKEGVRAATSYMTKQVEPVLEKLIRAKGKIEEVI